jgi:hypothetical protein
MDKNTYLRLPIRHNTEQLRCYVLYIKTTDETCALLLADLKEKIQWTDYALYQDALCQPEKRVLTAEEIARIRTWGNVYLYATQEEVLALLTRKVSAPV